MYFLYNLYCNAEHFDGVTKCSFKEWKELYEADPLGWRIRTIAISKHNISILYYEVPPTSNTTYECYSVQFKTIIDYWRWKRFWKNRKNLTVAELRDIIDF